MGAAYASSYIDALFEHRDAVGLHTVISVRARSAQLPDECRLFLSVLEWLGCDWQYYDTLKEEDFREVCRLLEKFGMAETLIRYRLGRASPEDAGELQRWLDAHETSVREELFRHASNASDFLKQNG